LNVAQDESVAATLTSCHSVLIRKLLRVSADAARRRRCDADAMHSQVVLAASTVGIGWLMVLAGLGKKRLAWREPGLCRRCGRPLETCSCPQRH
jgi:hypothetical protein